MRTVRANVALGPSLGSRPGSPAAGTDGKRPGDAVDPEVVPVVPVVEEDHEACGGRMGS